MNGILGMTGLALDTALTPDQREYLTLAKSSADSLLQVINDILDFSKIEAGKLELDPIDFELRDSLGDVMKTLAVRADQKGLEITYRVLPEVPDALIGDPGRLRQVLVNLVGNAIKFTEQGEVAVQVEKGAESAGEVRLRFSVRDTGIGIQAEKQAAVFGAFTQADGSTTRKYGGTGLGLTITRQLVELMGGSIWVESEADQGSTFSFTANFSRQGAEAAKRAAPRTVRLEGLPVLVVDDNATNRRILEETLHSWRMAPTAVESGPAALAAMEAASAAGRPFSKGDRERCLEAGMDGYVPKPLQAQALFAAIDAVVSPSAPAPSAPAPSPPSPLSQKLGEGELETGTGCKASLSQQFLGEGPGARAPEPAFDRIRLLARLDGDEALLTELVSLFREDSPRLLAAVREAIDQKDDAALERAAHALKGSVGNFCAPAAFEAAQRLEQLGREGDLAEVAAALAALERELGRLEAVLPAAPEQVSA